MTRHSHSDNTIFTERREETDAIINLSTRNKLLMDAIKRSRRQLSRGYVILAKQTLDTAVETDRRMGDA